jgi:drug/metabolite transporter (DMT)-like permease
LYAALMTWTILGEAPGWHHLVGGLFILSGVFLAMVTAQPRQHHVNPPSKTS